MNHPPRTIWDSIHGYITIHPLCNEIIDTPQFQRLRHIKQLGFCHYVFPSGEHTRFLHSLGVSHLAGYFIKQLQMQQPSLNITQEEILCVEIAGLCHDLGHGPFSHFWEKFIIDESDQRDCNISYSHEAVSVNMLEYLIQANDLEKEFLKYNLNLDSISTIKNMIMGNLKGNENRAFLYQIVNNEKSGLDVDKWDYLLRDSYLCGLNINFEYHRLVNCSRVINVDGMYQICFRDKACTNILNMFRSRSNLHEIVYSHRVVREIEGIFHNALKLCYKYLKIKPQKSKNDCDVWKWTIDACITHKEELKELFFERMERFCSLTDYSVFGAMENQTGFLPSQIEAKRLLDSISSRKFKQEFKFIGKLVTIKSYDLEYVKVCILNHANLLVADLDLREFEKHIYIQKVEIHWGKKECNPLDFVYFYTKDNVYQGITFEDSEIDSQLPKTFLKNEIRVYGKSCDNEKLILLGKCLENFQGELFPKARVQ